MLENQALDSMMSLQVSKVWLTIEILAKYASSVYCKYYNQGYERSTIFLNN
jgi:hypothetical protein